MRNQMPSNPEAEVAVLGSIYLDSELYPEISDILSRDDFYDVRNRELWTILGECIRKGQCDLVTIKAAMQEKGVYDKIGGIERVVEVANLTPLGGSAVKWARIVEDCGKRRRMMKEYAAAYERLSDMSNSVEDVNRFVQGAVLVPNAARKNTYGFNEAYERFAASYNERKKNGLRLPGISTGYEVLDYSIGGLEKGKMYVIGGRPAMGKSAFMLNMAFKMARNEKTIAIFSLEMSAEQIVQRISALGAGIDSQWIRQAKLSEKDITFIRKTRDTINDNIIINDSTAQTINGIMTECMNINTRLNSAGKRIDCVFIDHMQLMQADGRYTDRRTQIGEISRGCKILAGQLECPVVIASQLSRELRNRGSKRPQLTDLRESGDIEQDADVVLLLHREGYYHQGEDDWNGNPNKAEAIVAKNREGSIGPVFYNWIPEQTKFTEYGWDKQGV